MTRYAKDALLPGEWHVPDGKGGRTVQHFTPERIGHLTTRLSEMLADELSVPVCKEHQETAAPRTPEEYEQYLRDKCDLLVGHTEDGYLDGDKLEILLEVPTAEDEATVGKTRFISPMIDYDFVDGKGKLWPGESITHFAITPRPVQHGQKPFRPITARLGAAATALSQNAAAGKRPAGYPFCLSLAGYRPLQLSEDPSMADDVVMPDVATEEPPAIPSPAETEEADHFAECIQLLKEHDPAIVLPEDTTEENFCERLKSALVAIKNRETGETEAPPENTPPNEVPQPVSEPQVMMSLNGQQRALVKRLKDENVQLRAAANKRLHGGVQARIKALRKCGFISEKTEKRLSGRVPQLQMSLQGTPTNLEEELADLEEAALLNNFRLEKTALSLGDTPQPVEEEDSRGGSRRHQEEAGDQLAALAGARVKKK